VDVGRAKPAEERSSRAGGLELVNRFEVTAVGNLAGKQVEIAAGGPGSFAEAACQANRNGKSVAPHDNAAMGTKTLAVALSLMLASM
jgi:hypothetical protein